MMEKYKSIGSAIKQINEKLNNLLLCKYSKILAQ